jgi:hypothetical protein
MGVWFVSKVPLEIKELHSTSLLCVNFVKKLIRDVRVAIIPEEMLHVISRYMVLVIVRHGSKRAPNIVAMLVSHFFTDVACDPIQVLFRILCGSTDTRRYA